MSDYHVIGIDHAGKLQSLTCDNSKEKAMAYAQSATPRFKQLFMVSRGKNVQEIEFKAALGAFAPVVDREF